VARYGVSTKDVIERVKEKIKALEAGLPSGVKIVPFYDRSALIERAANTLRHALIEEVVIVTLVNIYLGGGVTVILHSATATRAISQRPSPRLRVPDAGWTW
jgi:Cu/Ag efflux pump CusA